MPYQNNSAFKCTISVDIIDLMLTFRTNNRKILCYRTLKSKGGYGLEPRSDAPRLLSEHVLLNRYGKIVMTRIYRWPDGTNKDFLVWGGKNDPCIIFALTDTDEVILERQFRWGMGDFATELPGGIIENNESFEHAARRELLEETGYEPQNIIRCGPSLQIDPASCFTCMIPVLATGCRKIAEPKPDAGEIIEVITIPINQWVNMIMTGQVLDAKAIAVTMLSLAQLTWIFLDARELIR